MSKIKYDLFVCSEELSSEDEIKILPLGLVKSQKGEFVVDNESLKLMKNHFKSRGLDIVVDYEHQTLNGGQAPAGGWIKDFYIKKNCIVAKVEWTEKAKEYIKNKEYRYLSPVIQVRKNDKKAVVLHSVALTNTPAIDNMYTIANSLYLDKNTMNECDVVVFGVDKNLDDEGDELMDLLNQLISLLGLNEGATESEVLEKLKALMNTSNDEVVANKYKPDEQGTKTKSLVLPTEEFRAVLQLLDLKESATQEEVTNSIMALKKPVNTNVELELKELKEKMATKEANELVEMALKDGKITPAQKDWATQYALTSQKGFEEYVKNAPQVVPLGELNQASKIIKPTSDYDTLACSMLGVSEEDIKKYGGVE